MSLPQSPVPAKFQNSSSQLVPAYSSVSPVVGTAPVSSSGPLDPSYAALQDALQQIQRLQQENNNLQNKISFHELELKKSKSELDSYYNTLERSKSLDDEIISYKRQLLLKDEELLQMKIDLRNNENDKNRLNKKLEELSIDSHKEIINMKNEYELKLNSLENDIKNYVQTIQQKESDINALRNKNMELSKQVENRMNGNSGSVSPVPSISNNVSSNNLNEMKWKEQLEQAERDRQKLQLEYEGKVKMMDSIQLQLQSMEKENLQLTSNIMHRQNEIKSLNEQVHSLTNSLQQAQQQLEQAKSQQQQGSVVTSTTSDTSALEATNTSLTLEIQQLKSIISQKEHELSVKQQSLDFLQQEISKTQETLRKKEIEIVEMRSRLFNTEQSNHLLTQTHEQTVQQLNLQLENLLKQNKELQEEILIQQKKTSEVSLTSSDHEEKWNKKNREYQSLQSEHSLLLQKYDSLQQDLQQQLKDNQTTQANLRQQYDQRLRDKELNIDRLNSSIHNFELEVKTLQDNLASATSSANNKALPRTFSAVVKLSNVSAQTDITTANDEELITKERFEEEIEKARQINKNKDEKIFLLQQKYQLLENSINELTEKNQFFESQLTLAEAKYQHLHSTHQQTLQNLASSTAATQANDVINSTANATMTTTLAAKEQEINQLKRQQALLEEKIQSSEKMNQTLLATISTKDSDYINLRSEKDSLSNEITTLQFTLQSKELEISSIKSELINEEKKQEIKYKLKIQSLEQENVYLNQQLQHHKSQELMTLAGNSSASSTSNNGSNAANMSEMTSKIMKLQFEYDQSRIDVSSKQKTIELLQEEITSLQQKMNEIRIDRDDLQEKYHRLQLTSQKQGDEIQMKEKRLKGFTEELLQVQKKLDDFQQKKYDCVSMFCQTDVQGHDIDYWKKAASNNHHANANSNRPSPSPTIPSSFPSGIEEHLYSIKSELEERRKESQLLFQLLQQFAPQAGGSHTEHFAAPSSHHTYESKITAPKAMKPHHKTSVQDDEVFYWSEGETNRDKRQPPHRSVFSPILPLEGVGGVDSSSGDDLESITEFHVFPVFSWTNHTIPEFFETFLKNFDALVTSILHSDVLFRKQTKYATSSSSEGSVTSSSAASALKKALLTRVRREEKFFASYTRLVESLKSFIGSGRKEIKRLKTLLSSSSISSSNNHHKKGHQDKLNKEQDASQKKEMVNQLSNQLNSLIRYTRSVQDYLTRRQDYYSQTKQQFSLNSPTQSIVIESKVMMSMMFETMKVYETMSKELKQLQNDGTEVHQTIQHEAATHAAQAASNAANSMTQSIAPQSDENHHQFHNILRSMDGGPLSYLNVGKGGMMDVAASYPPPSTSSGAYNANGEYFRASEMNRQVSSLNYQQKSALLHNELNRFSNQQRTSLQEIDKHKR